MRYNTLNCSMYSDTSFALKKSTRGYTMSQVFVMDREFAHAGHMSTESESGDALTQTFKSVGLPWNTVTYGAKERT